MHNDVDSDCDRKMPPVMERTEAAATIVPETANATSLAEPAVPPPAFASANPYCDDNNTNVMCSEVEHTSFHMDDLAALVAPQSETPVRNSNKTSGISNAEGEWSVSRHQFNMEDEPFYDGSPAGAPSPGATQLVEFLGCSIRKDATSVFPYTREDFEK